jgi:hypothetical protein
MHRVLRRRLISNWNLGVFVLVIVLDASTAAAHHSFAAEYDGKKPTTLSGTVTKVEWTNPHVHFFLDVKDPTGATAQWEFTMGAVNGLFRRGWNKEMLKPGDTVTVDGYLARDGSRLANARLVTLSDGRKMSGGTMPDAPGN